MPVIHEELTIRAPAEEVWRVVHEDLEHAPSWTDYLASAKVVKGGKPGPGARILYNLDLGAWEGTLELEITVWERPRRCAGAFVGGPLEGDWSYVYRQLKAGTKLVYDMDYELRGFLRLAGGMLKGQYEAGIRRSMAALKKHVESGGTA
jgi:uncharacterized membrane protein